MLAQMWSATESTSSGWSSAASSRSAQDLGLGLAAVDEQRELVAADPREHGRLADHLAQPARDALDRQVPELVAERVVDRLEVVEVEQHHRQRTVLALGGGERRLERLGQRRAVREAGQRVVVGPVARKRRLPAAEVDREHRHEAHRDERHARVGRRHQRRRERQHAAGGPRLEREVLAQVAGDRHAARATHPRRTRARG